MSESAIVLNSNGSVIDSNLHSELSLRYILDTYNNLPNILRV